MNRADLQKLANTRIREARILFNAEEYRGAYYLAGYAVECALKACFAKTVQRYDFPDKSRAGKVFTHRLPELAGIAGVANDLAAETKANPIFSLRWSLVCEWTEESRYYAYTRDEAEGLLDAIDRSKEGWNIAMAQATLLGPDLTVGSEITDVLEAAGIKLGLAMYMLDADYGDWRFAIASSSLDQTKKIKAYEKVFDALHGRFVYTLPQMIILPMKDATVRELRKRFADGGDVTGARVRGQTGNLFLEDAYLYRVQ